MGLKEWWEKTNYTSYTDQDILEKLSDYSYWTLDLFSMDAKRILKIEEISGQEYRILIAERLVRTIERAKAYRYASYENTGRDCYLGEPHNKSEEDLKKFRPGEIIPDKAGFMPSGYNHRNFWEIL